MGIIERLLGESAPVITPETRVFPGTRKRLIIVGNPNVGKSVLFNCLTGTYATVSNYPGTSVEVSRGELRLATGDITVVDTPGMYALLPITEEERVARNILFQEKPDLVIHVLDAKNLERMLPFTLQLLEADLPVILVLNIFDEAEKMGMHINLAALEKQLGIPVRATVSTTGKGLAELKEIISRTVTVGKPIRLSAGQLEPVVQALEKELPGDLGLSRRALGMLLLQDDEEVSGWIQARDPEKYQELQGLVETAKASSAQPLSYLIAVERQNQASRIVKAVLEYSVRPGIPAVERISRFMIQPVTGLPILLLILYFGLYQFVGVFGAGVLVNFIERDLFEKMINPWVVRLLTHALPWKVLQELFIGEYGMITLGLRYAVALILPIVTTFFIAFAVIEDSGYLPRLALLIDRVFKKIGLTGRAVIPMVLGLGCDTMATMVTRTLPTRRERLIATILLALAVPCSAQLGVILALLAGNPKALWVWLGVILLVFLLVGFLSSRLLPGAPPSFYMEIPPLRLPNLSNVLMKTYTRVKWYFMEIFPMFIGASLLIWIGQITGLFVILTHALEYPVRWIGLPPQAAASFLFGFFRRDYGAGGLYDMQKAGLLTGNQMLVACVTLTLFLPCIAQFLMNVKERGWRTGVGISFFILWFSFTTGFLIHRCLLVLGVHL